MQNINRNLELLEKNQKSEIIKISELTSFASHITERYNKDLKLINHNTDETIKALNSVTDKLNTLQLISLEISNVKRFHERIKILERTINLAKLEIPNIEILTVEELMQIHQYSMKLYKTEQLISFDNTHPFEILSFSKFTLIVTNEAVVMILKIPILSIQSYHYSKIYPLPNIQNKILIPPSQFHLESDDEKWTDNCHHHL